eukprot:CAMPEP_0181297196 /NCGR_PEP_ID=MMETSP1101-20121128/5108_1 /TAXON_ID=46948 /ORGANISM="Rhodomonas abbreviata, Strain Caron Lab Isolate" /LENGTH=302 /DNA_ID=CAMNT_0023402111 /DNA_START=143 /DNA_END=1048 /DNA_ORIENTATION=+
MVVLEKNDGDCWFPAINPPTFDPKNMDLASEYLTEHGYCVFQDVVNETEISEIRELLREDLLAANPSIPKDTDLEEFTEEMVATNEKGLSVWYAHGKAAWHVRLLPSVRKIFSNLLEVEEDKMVSSFDVVALSVNGAKHGTNQWWGHVDHAKYSTAEGQLLPGADITAFQSSLYMTDATHDSSTSFVAVPGSHKHWEELVEDHRRTGTGMCCPRCASQHFLPASKERWLDKAVRVRVRKGALLVWNSKLIHQSAAPHTQSPAHTHTASANPQQEVADTSANTHSQQDDDHQHQKQQQQQQQQ